MDLGQAEDRADGGEQTQQEQTHHAGLLGGFDIQPKKQRDGEEDDEHIADDREDGESIESASDGETCPWGRGIPGFFDLSDEDIHNQVSTISPREWEFTLPVDN